MSELEEIRNKIKDAYDSSNLRDVRFNLNMVYLLLDNLQQSQPLQLSESDFVTGDEFYVFQNCMIKVQIQEIIKDDFYLWFYVGYYGDYLSIWECNRKSLKECLDYINQKLAEIHKATSKEM